MGAGPISVLDIARKTHGAFNSLAWTNNVKWSPDDQARHQADKDSHLQALGLSPDAVWAVGHRATHGIADVLGNGELLQFNDSQHLQMMAMSAAGKRAF
jgi:hypothetical protein